MKRIKRLLALALAMMMAFAMMAIPAAAHGEEDEGIVPLYVVGKCTCGGTITRTSAQIGLYNGKVAGCSTHPATDHTHHYIVMHNHSACDSCNNATKDWTTNVDSGCNWPK